MFSHISYPIAVKVNNKGPATLSLHCSPFHTAYPLCPCLSYVILKGSFTV